MLRRETPGRYGLITAMALLVLAGLSSSARGADPVGDEYPPDQHSLTVYFDQSVPSGSFRTRIADSARSWESLAGVPQFKIVEYPSAQVGSNPCAEIDGAMAGAVLFEPIPGGASTTLAENRNCVKTSTGELVGFRQFYTPRFKFYVGEGRVPKKQYDLTSVATHELGHAIGWTSDHYGPKNRKKLCANNKKEPTMCPVIYQGSSQLRNLSTKDKNPMASAYSDSAAAEALPPAEPPAEPSPAADPSANPSASPVADALANAASALQTNLIGQVGAPGCLLRLIAAHRNPTLTFGRTGDDCIKGTLASDDLRGGRGNDTIVAGPGDDVIVPGTGSDLVLAGSGNDQIYAGGGGPTIVRCGGGFDRVFTADPGDRLVDCEQTPSDFTEIPLPPDYLRVHSR